ncbi:MAG: NAD-dependent epimerase/dehydratase family protein [Gammaproteobacteria bacterium]
MSSRAGMARGAKVYVAGHRGLLGSALVRGLRAAGFENLVTRAHAELDLGDAGAVRAFFARERPKYLFLAAAKVGGILANATYPADSHAIDAVYRAGAKRVLFLRPGPSAPGTRVIDIPQVQQYLDKE